MPNKSASGVSRKSYITPDEEQKQLMARGGPLIDEPYDLGDNLSGNKRLIVPAMNSLEELIRVPVKNCKSFRSAFTTASREIVLRMPEKNDVANVVPAFKPDGTRRAAISPELLGVVSVSFVDTIIAKSNSNSMGPVLDYFNTFGLGREGNPPPEKRIGIKPLRKKDGKFRWKITAADVPASVMQLLLSVYWFGTKWDGCLMTLARVAKSSLWAEKLAVLGRQYSDVIKAVEMVKSMELSIDEWDMTRDVPGTLDPFSYAAQLRSNGFDIIQNLRCGKNCVKGKPADMESESGQPKICFGVKGYNKLLESTQQGAVRSHGVDCKVDKIVNPSTQGLKRVVVDERYNTNGITRLETTFFFNRDFDACEPLWQDMEHIMDKQQSLLASSLVTCSFHDTFVDLGRHAQTSAIFYEPHVFKEKRRMWLTSHPNPVARKALSRDLKDMPDGLVVRYINSDTTKMNGVAVYGVHDTRSPDDSAGHRLLLHAAACSTSGTDPVGFLCVAGWEQFFDKPGPKHLYFRRVQLNRYPVGKTQLDTCFLSQSDASVTPEWAALNVDVDSLISLKPCIVKEQHLSFSEIQTDISIDCETPVPQQLDCDSENAETMGFYRGIRLVKDEYMPKDFRQISKLSVGTLGRLKTERCRFRYEGDWFWVPKDTHEKMKVYVGQLNVIILVRWGQRGFECMVENHDTTVSILLAPSGGTSTGTDTLNDRAHDRLQPETNPSTQTQFIGQPSRSDQIPVQNHPHVIHNLGFRKAKGDKLSSYVMLESGYYWLPKSLTERIIMKMESETGRSVTNDSVDHQQCFLNSFFLCRTENCRIGVTGHPNPEPLISITDKTGEVIISQPETMNSRKKRGLQVEPKRRRLA